MLSMRRHANFIKRFKSVSCLFTASILFPMPISAAVSDYDALVIEAREVIAHRYYVSLRIRKEKRANAKSGCRLAASFQLGR